MRLHDPIPSFEGAARWVGGGPVGPADVSGRPVLVHLWSSACDTCREQLAELRHWEQEFGPRGLLIVSIHARTVPEQRDEEAIELVREAGLDHPMAFDGDEGPITRRLGATLVPSYYLFDARGRLRHRQGGYLAATGTEAAIRRILEEADAPAWQH